MISIHIFVSTAFQNIARAMQEKYCKLTQILSTFVKKFGEIGKTQLEQLEEGLELHLLSLVEMRCRGMEFSEECMRPISAGSGDAPASGFVKIVEVMLNLLKADDKFDSSELTAQERLFVFLCKRASNKHAPEQSAIFESLLVAVVPSLDLIRRDNLSSLDVCRKYLEQYKATATAKNKGLDTFMRDFEAYFEYLKNQKNGEFEELDVEELVEKKQSVVQTSMTELLKNLSAYGVLVQSNVRIGDTREENARMQDVIEQYLGGGGGGGGTTAQGSGGNSKGRKNRRNQRTRDAEDEDAEEQDDEDNEADEQDDDEEEEEEVIRPAVSRTRGGRAAVQKKVAPQSDPEEEEEEE